MVACLGTQTTPNQIGMQGFDTLVGSHAPSVLSRTHKVKNMPVDPSGKQTPGGWPAAGRRGDLRYNQISFPERIALQG